MKQFLNISALICVLSIPFALSSQTRKAIPAGRYEALSGVKNSRTSKAADMSEEAGLKTESANIVWNEALKHLPPGNVEVSYFSKSDLDPLWASLMSSKGLVPSKNVSTNTQIIFSDNLRRDLSLVKILSKGKIVILKDNQSLNDLLSLQAKYEVLAYQVAEDSNNLFLLKIK